MLVWKFDEDSYEILSNGDPKLIKSHKVECLCDMSIISFIKIIADLQMSYEINQYNTNPLLLAKKKDFKVKLGFGLNLGWAIEGAIGSAYKIDASYLSPNVNMASRLEAATIQYKTDILISDN